MGNVGESADIESGPASASPVSHRPRILARLQNSVFTLMLLGTNPPL